MFEVVLGALYKETKHFLFHPLTCDDSKKFEEFTKSGDQQQSAVFPSAKSAK